MLQRIIQFSSQPIFLITIQDSIMAQYDEYLQYLKHVDDTTLQDFEKEKRKLQEEITATKNQSKQEIKSIEDKCKQETEKQKLACETKISDIKQQFKDKESVLNQTFADAKKNYEEEIKSLKNKLSIEKARYTKDTKKMTSEIEICRTDISTLTHKANMYEQLYNNVQPKLKSLSNIRGLLVALITICSFGIFLVLYFFYWIFNLKNYFSINRWIQCDKYETPWVVKRL